MVFNCNVVAILQHNVSFALLLCKLNLLYLHMIILLLMIFQLADREIAKSNIMLIILKKTYLSKSVPKNWFDSGCIGRCPNPHHRW